jgi:hypothetical protein
MDLTDRRPARFISLLIVPHWNFSVICLIEWNPASYG